MSRYTDAQVLNLGSYHVFPNWTINILPETCLLQRWRPHATDPERLTYDVVTLLPPVSGGRLRTLAAAGRDDNVIQAPTKYTRPQRQYVDDARDLGTCHQPGFLRRAQDPAGFAVIRFQGDALWRAGSTLPPLPQGGRSLPRRSEVDGRLRIISRSGRRRRQVSRR
jgi:hypothetical protein